MLNNPFQSTAAAIANDVREQLRDQGHYLTGDLDRSLQPYVELRNGSYLLTADALDYIETLETGIPASEVQVSASKIDELTRYATLRFGKQGKAAVSTAVAILAKQRIEGNPTKGSYAFSKTGKRTEAVADTFTENESRYFSMVDNDVLTGADAVLSQIKSGKI